jgi:ribosome-binding factor A
MQPVRRARLEAVILEELAKVVPREIKDPRVQSVTFTSCQVTPDGSQATVLVTLLGGLANPEAGRTPKEEAALKDCLKGLNSSAGYLRRHMAGVLSIRHIPTIMFKEDKGFENTFRVNELLKQLASEKPGEKPAAKTDEEK